ncbi:MAG: hypothetical protein LLF94_00355 [Chlamydiales bacterium]|nr:hypothetical protein [Chlamydiales bacterium]
MFTYLFTNLLASPEYPQGLKIENIHIPKGASQSKEDLSTEELAALSANFPDSIDRETLELNEQLWIAQARAIEYEALIDALGPIDLPSSGRLSPAKTRANPTLSTHKKTLYHLAQRP